MPRTLAYCDDAEVTGAPFYVMEHVDGLIVTKVETAERLSPEARAAAARSLVQTLTELQAVDLDAAGLGDFKRPESLASRQLRRWTRQWQASKTAELPVIEEVAELLAGRMPEERESVLVHGDYRLDNAVVSEDGEVRAVLDWELCTVGDPLADVGLLRRVLERARHGRGSGGSAVPRARDRRRRLPDRGRARRRVRARVGSRPRRARLLDRVRLLEGGDHRRGRLPPLAQRPRQRLRRRRAPAGGRAAWRDSRVPRSTPTR